MKMRLKKWTMICFLALIVLSFSVARASDPENQLIVYVDGVDYDTQEYDYYLEFQNSLTMKVRASAPEDSVIEYEWRYQTIDPLTDIWSDEVTIDGANSDTYTMQSYNGRVNYYCIARDQYGNQSVARFILYTENHLFAKIAGLDVDTEWHNYHVLPGDMLTMALEPSGDDLSGLTYEWRYQEYDSETGEWTQEQVIEGVDGGTYTLEHFSRQARYWCIIRDRFGNTRSAWFYLYVDNQLQVSIDGLGYDAFSHDYYLSPGRPFTMKVRVSAADMSGLTYYWKREIYDDESHSSGEEIIEGANTDSYTVDSFNDTSVYQCFVRDQYGSFQYVIFRLHIDNHLRAYADLPDRDDIAQFCYMTPGQDQKLGVRVYADNMTGITYEWRYRQYDIQLNSWSAEQVVEDCIGDTCTVENFRCRADYQCIVRDQYGSYQIVYFYLYVENHLEAFIDGLDSNRNSYDYYLTPGESLTMKVRASADDMSQLTYEWNYRDYDSETGRWGTDQNVAGAESNSYTMENFQNRAKYTCTVRDQYGNESNLYFYLLVENHFHAFVDDDAYDADMEKIDYYVQAGTSKTLKVRITGENLEGVTYQWMKQQTAGGGYFPVDNNSEDHYIATDITEKVWYVCLVEDAYGSFHPVYFDIYVDNEFNAKAERDEFFVTDDEPSVTMEVTAGCREGNLRYVWHCYTTEGYVEMEGETGSSCTVAVNGLQMYRCTVKDQYENSREVRFYIYPMRTPQPLTLATEYSAEISDTLQFYSFTPQTSGAYAFYSMGGGGTVGRLYDADMKLLKADNESGEEDDFSLKYMLTAGNHYIYTVGFGKLYQKGSFTVKLDFTNDFQHVLTLPASMTTIESEAFAGLANVDAVRIPASVVSIADDAFEGSQVVIITPHESNAENWAREHEFEFINE